MKKTTLALVPFMAAGLGVLAPFDSARAQRGAAPGGPPPAAREAAPIDLTGYWVSIVNEDWRWRMVTPPPGDYASVPLNDAGREAAGGWDLEADAGNGNACRPFGVGGIMRVPGRVHITWPDADTLQIDTDAGSQTRLLYFAPGASPAGEPTWQGRSTAAWERVGGGRGQASGGTLKVVTTGMKMGYLRWNGVPYSENAVITEYFDRHGAFDQEWFTVTTIVEDPTYLNQPFVTSTHFRREPDGSKWDPTPCRTEPPTVGTR